jgi:hypothetical protein
MRSKRTGMDDAASRKALWPSQIKAPWVKVSSVLIASYPPSHPRLLIRFTRLREMPPLSRQSTVFLQSKLTEELNSELFWIDGVIASAFHNETIRLFEDTVTPLEGSPAPAPEHLLPLFDDDHLGPPSTTPGDAGRVNFVNFPSDVWPVSFGNQPDDLYATFPLSPSLSIITTDCTFILHHVASIIPIR